MKSMMKTQRNTIKKLNDMFIETYQQVKGIDIFNTVYDHQLVIHKLNKKTGEPEYYMLNAPVERDFYGRYYFRLINLVSQKTFTVTCASMFCPINYVYRQRGFFLCTGSITNWEQTLQVIFPREVCYKKL